MYIWTGKMNAKAVHAKDPIRLMKRPNFGMSMASTADSKTSKVRRKRRLVGRKLVRVGILLYKLDDSMISKTGMSCIGYEPRRPKQ